MGWIKIRNAALVCMFFLVWTGGAKAQQNCSTPCPAIPWTNPTFPLNSQVAVILPSAGTSASSGQINQAGWDALAELGADSGATGNGSGVTFQNYDDAEDVFESDPNAPAVVTVNYDTTTAYPTNPTTGTQVVAQFTQPTLNANGNIDGATVTVYLGSRWCTPQGGLCFNPNQPGYQQAIEDVIEHELMHGLGYQDVSTTSAQTPGASLMNAYTGVNDSSGSMASSPTCCDNNTIVTNECNANSCYSSSCDNYWDSANDCGLGQSCDPNIGCPGNLSCTAGTCSCDSACSDPACPGYWDASNGCGQGQACSSDDDCPGGLGCLPNGGCGCKDICDEPSCDTGGNYTCDCSDACDPPNPGDPGSSGSGGSCDWVCSTDSVGVTYCVLDCFGDGDDPCSE
jgi:hypothetical protein